jgi:gluconolactonase
MQILVLTKSGMVTFRIWILIALLGGLWAPSSRDIAAQEETYETPPEAQKQEGVPEGKVLGPFDFRSNIYAGTERQYWIYVPAQYDAEKPACSLIVQDGLNRANGWRLPTICDNLIHANEMPVTIGIFVSPGIVPATKDDAQPRFNRSFEYDSLGDRYARFLLEELIPEVAKTYNLSTNPNDRALAGASSGGICAFNAAWERPHEFRRVISTIGTFVGLRGGNQLSGLVRKTEPKPLRVFLQDGSADLNIYAGDWWMANQDMLSALRWAGYDVHHVWGEGGHNGRHAAAIMPEALRWLWRDYPEPIRAAPHASEERRVNVLVPGANWEQLSSGHGAARAPAANAAGELYFSDSKAGRIYRVDQENKTRIFADQTGAISSMGFGPDGKLYGVKDNQQIVRFSTAGQVEVVIESTGANALVTLPGGFFYSDPSKPAVQWSDYKGASSVVLPLRTPIVALAPSPDHAFLHLVGEEQLSLHARISADGSLEHRQEYGFLEMPYAALKSGASGLVVDQKGRVYVSTPIGIQVLDQLGRVNFIIAPPPNEAMTGIALGGAAGDTLYVTTSRSVFRRKLNVQGNPSFGPPVQPPSPQL